jgi:hypothetical protein
LKIVGDDVRILHSRRIIPDIRDSLRRLLQSRGVFKHALSVYQVLVDNEPEIRFNLFHGLVVDSQSQVESEGDPSACEDVAAARLTRAGCNSCEQQLYRTFQPFA